MDDKPLTLQLCPLAPHLEQLLRERTRCVSWFAMDHAQQTQWLAEHASDTQIVVTGGHLGCPSDLLTALPALRLVAIHGVGFDRVDLTLAAERKVRVTNTPDVLTEDVADLAIGLIIALKRALPAADRFVREGQWPTADMPLGRKVSGSKFGIVGLGRIGGAIADRLSAFGEIGYTARGDKENDWRYFGDAEALAAWCDVLVVACVASPSTSGLIDAGVLGALGKNGCLINVSRGSVVDEQALIDALDSGTIAGAALDVFAAEPNVPQALRSSERTVLAPHIGSGTVETREAMGALMIANIDALLAGRELVTPLV